MLSDPSDPSDLCGDSTLERTRGQSDRVQSGRIQFGHIQLCGDGGGLLRHLKGTKSGNYICNLQS